MMPSLFDKLESIQVNNTDLLTSEDRVYCDALFNTYTKEKEKLELIFAAIQPQYESFRSMDYQQTFYYAVNKATEHIEEIFELADILNRALIDKMEYHFKEKYNIVFDSYVTKLPKKNRYYDKAQEPEKFYTGYEEIILNMTRQVGTDFLQVALTQNIEAFKKQFHFERDKPVLAKTKIHLPDYSYWTRYGSRSDNKSFHVLFALISYFNTNSFAYSNAIETISRTVGDLIGEKPEYAGEKLTDIQFYKNNKITLSFASEELAKSFWQKFQFDNIISNLRK